jgi:hypothetical protein
MDLGILIGAGLGIVNGNMPVGVAAGIAIGAGLGDLLVRRELASRSGAPPGGARSG